MRQAIKHMSFDPSVKKWSYAQFQERYKDQLTAEEIRHFASILGLVSEPAADKRSLPVNVEDQVSEKRMNDLAREVKKKKRALGDRDNPINTEPIDNREKPESDVHPKPNEAANTSLGREKGDEQGDKSDQ